MEGDAFSGATNMALDHALAELLGPSEGVVRLYGWERPTVSFGRHEPAAGLYDLGVAERLGVAFVRRPTGGRAVLHDRELTYSVIAPARALGGARSAYGTINACLSEALASLGAPVQVVDRSDGPTATPAAGPCFGLPAHGEVIARGRKLVGSAQARIGQALLQHGSIILDGGQADLAQLRSEATVPETATLRELVGELAIEAVCRAVVAAFTNRWGGSWRKGTYTPQELASATKLEADRYLCPEWTWSR